MVVVSLKHRPPLPPRNAPGTHVCKRLSRPQSHSASGRILCQRKIPMTQTGIEPATFRFVAHHCPTAITKYLLSEALQLQRSFRLLNECLSFGPVSDAVLPVCYFHPCYVALYIILPSIFLVFLAILLVRVTTRILFLPCCYLAYDAHVRTKLIFNHQI